MIRISAAAPPAVACNAPVLLGNLCTFHRNIRICARPVRTVQQTASSCAQTWDQHQQHVRQIQQYSVQQMRRQIQQLQQMSWQVQESMLWQVWMQM